MPYILYKTNGLKLTVVDDAALDLSTSLTFVGKNYAGYGQIINQNLIKLLENFANTAAPAKIITGQTWFDTVNQKLRIYTGTAFKTLSSMEVSSSQPHTLTTGDFWFNTSNKKLYVKSDTTEQFVLVGPSDNTIAGSRVEAVIIKDSFGSDKTVLQQVIKGQVFSVSSVEEFTPADTSIFSVIKKGITIANADATTGKSSVAGNYFWGTAAHALRLGDYSASDYVLKSQNSTSTFNSQIKVIDDGGIVIGNNQIFKLYADSGTNRAKIGALYNAAIDINLTRNNVPTDILSINTSTVYPATGADVSLGTVFNPFNYVFANSISGRMVDGQVNFRSGSILSNFAQFKISANSTATSLLLSTDNPSGSIILGNNALVVSSNATVNVATGTTITHVTGNKVVGYRDVPQFRSIANVAITLAATDLGGHILVTSPGASITVPVDSTVSLPVGSTVTIINSSAGSSTIIQASGTTVQLAGGTSTGNRTLAAGGIATLVKTATNYWFVAGAGLT
jgi:hypothetical protein